MQHEEDIVHEAEVGNTDASSARELYLRDLGELPFDARRVLVQLLNGPSIDEAHHSKLWTALLADERRIRSRLADLFLELIFDKDAGVAFVQQADTGELDAPRLLQSLKLTYTQSVVIIELRGMLAAADARGERAVVSYQDLADKIDVYDKGVGTDRAAFKKRVKTAIDSIRSKGFLQKIRGSEDRYEISPTLKFLFSIDQMRALEKAYREHGMDVGSDAESEAETGEAEE